MKLGFLTACLLDRSLPEIAAPEKRNHYGWSGKAVVREGVLSVEHEDPVWGGTEEKVHTGLEVAHRTLRPLIVA